MARALPDRNLYLNRLPPTPLIAMQLSGDEPVIWCKLEFLNPSGSTKDRIARFILEKAWREGRLTPGDTVIEASSGSTSIAMALACAQLGVRFLAVMPEGVSNERVLMIRAYGGQIRFTPAAAGIGGALAETERLGSGPHTFLPRQFSNPDNARAHQTTTAREILDQIPGGSVDAVVSGVGTGGSLVGLYNGLAESGCPARPFLARPVDLSGPVEAECCSFSTRIPGVVECVSTIFREDYLAGLEVLEIRSDEALEMARALLCKGLPVGPSSGLNYAAAVRAATRLEPGARIVTLFPDRMERYFTTDLFSPYRT